MVRSCASSSSPRATRRQASTGGSGGIGAAICRALAAEDALVAVGYGRGAEAANAVARELSAGGGRAEAFGADLEDPRAPGQFVDEVEARLGSVDILVANHGLGVGAAYQDVDPDLFDRTMAINLRAPFLLAQRVLAGMRERHFGRILFVSSTAAFRGGVIGPHYAPPTPMHGLTYFLAGRTAADGVTVNAIAPGSSRPECSRVIRAHSGSGPGGPGWPRQEVADLALAILRNAYLTSHVISLDGGLHPG